MARVFDLFAPAAYYRCDLCNNLTGRVVTDSYTEKDICFDCASTGGSEGGLFWRVTQDPEEDGGDNLMQVAKELDLLDEDEEEEEEEEALV